MNTPLDMRLVLAETPEEVRRVMQAATPQEIGALAGRAAYPVPGPYEIAMAFGAALASSGRYDTPGAAMAAAWASIPEFYQSRDFYLKEVAPAFYGAPGPLAPPLDPGGPRFGDRQSLDLEHAKGAGA